MQQYTVIDLFCGAGGFSEGFKQAGFKIILGIDNWKPAVESFKQNQKTEVWQENITNLKNIPYCDVLIGSPPCTGHSIAKQCIKRSFDLTEVNAFLSLVQKVKPKVWIMENSPELIKQIGRGYPYQIIKACGFGLRQRRRRAFIGTLPHDFQTYCNGHEHIPTVCATEWKGCSSATKREKLNRYSDYLGRKATTEECRKEMGFPEDYVFIGNTKDQYIQIGNAVCPPVSLAVAKSVKQWLGMWC